MNYETENKFTSDDMKKEFIRGETAGLEWAHRVLLEKAGQLYQQWEEEMAYQVRSLSRVMIDEISKRKRDRGEEAKKERNDG